jgi:hypothetical protein
LVRLTSQALDERINLEFIEARAVGSRVVYARYRPASISVMNVLVTGGTGALGHEVIRRMRESGHRPRILSRRPGADDDWVQGDLVTGLGLEQAVHGIDAMFMQPPIRCIHVDTERPTCSARVGC